MAAAARSATRPITLTTTHASRNQARLGLTGIHAQADRQIRTIASAVVTVSSGAANARVTELMS